MALKLTVRKLKSLIREAVTSTSDYDHDKVYTALEDVLSSLEGRDIPSLAFIQKKLTRALVNLGVTVRPSHARRLADLVSSPRDVSSALSDLADDLIS